MIEVVKPVIEFRYSAVGTVCQMHPGHRDYDKYASFISEGWCPLSIEEKPHRVEPVEDGWLGCEAGAYFRLVYPNQIEDE